MKPIILRNRMNNEKVVCENIRDVREIEGVAYLVVHRPGNSREFLMRKDALVKENSV